MRDRIESIHVTLLSAVLFITFLFLGSTLYASGNALPSGESSPTEQSKVQTELPPVPQQADQKDETPKPELRAAPADVSPYSSNPAAVKAVDRSIWLFAERLKEKFSLWLTRSGKYLDLMKEILKANNIPEDIVFLSLIESGFSPNAYSVARAVGPWQFIASTGKRYGLKIDWWRDERRDPVKSTEAAASYLKDLYGMFGSWNLAMAAYNAGEGKILKAVNRSKGGDYWALLNTSYIRKETKEYVPHFIAAKMIAADPQAYGFENVSYHAPLAYDEVVLDAPVDLEVIARCADVGLDTIRELNPELRRWSTPANVPSYIVKIPAGKKDLFTENFSKVPEDERFSIVRYTVKKGDTLAKIAGRAGVPVNVIIELNGGMKPPKAGETICLPPIEKFAMDRDDRAVVKKVAHKKSGKARKSGNRKVIVAAYHKKDTVLDD
jgi:membrane-bound lytic murein transglycosylase D